MDLMNLLQGQLSEEVLGQLSQQIGGEKEQTASAANGIIQTLIGGLAKNAGSEGGASALADALDKDHADGGILSNLTSLIGGQLGGSGAANGLGILQHILGGKQNAAAEMIGQNSGLSGGQVGNLMQILAPLVMSQLGQAKQQNGLDAGGIASLLTNVVGGQQQQAGGNNGFMGMVTNFLDKDGDGSAMDEIGGMLMNQLFKK